MEADQMLIQQAAKDLAAAGLDVPACNDWRQFLRLVITAARTHRATLARLRPQEDHGHLLSTAEEIQQAAKANPPHWPYI